MLEFLRDQASDSEEVVTPLMLDGTYLYYFGVDYRVKQKEFLAGN